MRRAWVVGLAVVLLASCQSAPEQPAVVEAPREPECETPVEAPLQRWIGEMTAVAVLSMEEVRAQLARPGASGETPLEQFHFALLNQRLEETAGWVRSRDALRTLREQAALDEGLQQLTGVLLDYSQAMINAHARQTQMALELAAAQQEQDALEAKIEALTNLEQSISERKNNGDEPAAGERQ